MVVGVTLLEVVLVVILVLEAVVVILMLEVEVWEIIVMGLRPRKRWCLAFVILLIVGV